MQVNFIGHGFHKENQINVGEQLAVSFDSNIYDSFYGFVAFAAVCKLPQKQYGLKVDKMFNFKTYSYEKKHIYSCANSRYIKRV